MEETLEIYDHYYDKYRDGEKDLESYYEALAEKEDRDWEDM